MLLVTVSTTALPVQFPANTPGKVAENGSKLEDLPPAGDLDGITGPVQPHLSHWGSDLVNGRSLSFR